MKGFFLFCIGQPDIGNTFCKRGFIRNRHRRKYDGISFDGKRPWHRSWHGQYVGIHEGKRNRDPRAIRGSGPERPKERGFGRGPGSQRNDWTHAGQYRCHSSVKRWRDCGL